MSDLTVASSLRGVAGEGGVVGRWFTPPKLAKRFAEWSRVAGCTVVDLGCGEFALSRAAMDAGASRVIAYDLIRPDSNTPNGVTFRFADADVTADEEEIAADVIISNPPWEENSVEAFVVASMNASERACFIAPLATLASAKRLQGVWSQYRITRLAVCARRPRFAGGGGKADVCFFEVIAAPPSGASQAIEFEILGDKWNGGDE
jgi:hypothetical protein